MSAVVRVAAVGILSVEASVLGNIVLGEVDHNIVLLKDALKCLYINVGNVTPRPYRKASRLACRLSCDYSRGYYAKHVPAVARTVGASSRGNDIGGIAPCKTAQRHLIEVIAEFKIIYSADRVVKVTVEVVFL